MTDVVVRRDRSGSGEVIQVVVGVVTAWTHALHIDGPLHPEAASLVAALETWANPVNQAHAREVLGEEDPPVAESLPLLTREEFAALPTGSIIVDLSYPGRASAYELDGRGDWRGHGGVFMPTSYMLEHWSGQLHLVWKNNTRPCPAGD